MKFYPEIFKNRYFLVILTLTTVVYFICVRFIQDLLYQRLDINGHVDGLFSSFGSDFIKPEPYEIPLYLLGFIVIPLVSYVFTILAYFTYYQFGSRQKGKIGLNLDHGIPDVTEASAAEPAIFLFKTKVEKFFKKMWPVWLLLLIALIFDPGLPIETHHYNYFIGAVNDVLLGKAILYESSHLYGLFSIYFLVGVFSLIPLTFPNFVLVIMFFYIIFFAGLWVVIGRWLRSYTLATLCCVVLVSVVYFLPSNSHHSVLFLPAMSPFRWWPYLAILSFVSSFQQTKNTIYVQLALFTSAAALFWNFDSGVFIAMATLITAAFINVSKRASYKSVLTVGGNWLAYFSGIFAATHLLNFFVYQSWPDWSLFFKESKSFSQGIVMNPLPAFGAFEAVILVYMFALMLEFYHVYMKKRLNATLLFLSAYGTFSFIYYIGESNMIIFMATLTPFIVIIFYGLHSIIRHPEWVRAHTMAIFGLLAVTVIGFIILGAKLPRALAQRDYSRFTEKLLHVQPQEEDTYLDARHIDQNYRRDRIALVSLNDTKLLLYSNKVNYFDFYYIFGIYFKSDMQRYVTQALRETPPFLFIGTGIWSNDQVEYFLSGVTEKYHLKESLLTVDVYELSDS